MSKLTAEEWADRKRRVLSKLNRHFSHSISDIVYRTGINRQAVYKILDELVEEGTIETVQEGKGFYQHDEWVLKRR